MPRLRRVPLLAAGLALALPAGAAAQSGAGDNQYQDPFGHSQSGSNGSRPHRSPGPSTPAPHRNVASTRAGGGSRTTLTQAPPVSSAPPASSGSRPSARHRSSSPAASGPGAVRPRATGRGLPATGLDVGAVALLGAGLLVCGLGLRLRTADARRA